jgi:hypothetical protein
MVRAGAYGQADMMPYGRHFSFSPQERGEGVNAAPHTIVPADRRAFVDTRRARG